MFINFEFIKQEASSYSLTTKHNTKVNETSILDPRQDRAKHPR